jgi:hypothetical protein
VFDFLQHVPRDVGDVEPLLVIRIVQWHGEDLVVGSPRSSMRSTPNGRTSITQPGNVLGHQHHDIARISVLGQRPGNEASRLGNASTL